MNRPRRWIIARDEKVLDLYFGLNGVDPLPPKEIAQQFDITPGTVYHIVYRWKRRSNVPRETIREENGKNRGM